MNSSFERPANEIISTVLTSFWIPLLCTRSLYDNMAFPKQTLNTKLDFFHTVDAYTMSNRFVYTLVILPNDFRVFSRFCDVVYGSHRD